MQSILCEAMLVQLLQTVASLQNSATDTARFVFWVCIFKENYFFLFHFCKMQYYMTLQPMRAHVSFQKLTQMFQQDWHVIQHNNTCGSCTTAQAAKYDYRE